MPDLRRVSTEELARELERRSAHYWREPKPIKHHCDECAHFVALSFSETAPTDYNPCSKGHKMRFRVPQSMGDVCSGNWGFYQRGCKDREVSK